MFILGNLQEVVDIFTDGGTVMAALAIVAFLLYTTATASLYFVFRGNLNHKQKSQWADWINDPDSAEGRVGEIIRYAIHGKKLSIKRVQRRFDEMREILIASIDRRLIIITTLVAAAPMTGLLGTVGGMLDMFDGLAAGGGKQSMGLIASGMKKALFTTLTGLVIALPGMFMSL
ncbi:MotA/TolQ/ExbB proton channel family protein, partial [Akkermansiaceae bacterium]|nr:MotA/TolQ/ExbB proton channel family protein [Akkermansiaceae bacterium]